MSNLFSFRVQKNEKLFNSKAAYRFCMSYIKSSLFDNQSEMQNAFLWKMPNFISKLVVIFCLSYRHIKSCCIADSLFSRMLFQLMLLFLNLDALCLYTQFTFSFVVVEHKKKKDQISLQTSTRNKQEDWRSSIFTHLSILRRNDVKGWFMSSILCLLYLLCNRKRLRKCLW